MPNQKRQLAAIMFTDIVGYTKLMGENSAKALELVRISRKIQMPLVEKHHGKWIKEMGDGVLAQFSSALDAVHCAWEIQKISKTDFESKLRIGIHLGDITFENNDVYGDGVNVAARLESCADPGGIYFSESVEKAIRGQSKFLTKYLGELKLKNVNYGVRTYALQGNGLPNPIVGEEYKSNVCYDSSSKSGDANRKRFIYLSVALIIVSIVGLILLNKHFSVNNISATNLEKSIAVLPFRNDSPNEENVYFCNGIMEGILDHLAKIPELTVVSRTSVEQYRKTSTPIPEIAKNLNVNYIVEGSVLRIGDRVQITAQLLYAPEDKHIWSDQFDKNIENADTIWSIMANVTQNIGRELEAKISPEIQERMAFVPTSDITSYDYFLQGKEHFYNWFRTRDNSNLANAKRLFDLAIKQDPSFGLAYAGKAAVYGQLRHVENYLDSLFFYSDKAISLDPSAAFAYVIRGGEYYMMGINDMKKAGEDLHKAFELNPNDDFMVRDLALYYTKKEEFIKAIEFFRKAERIGRDPLGLGATYYHWGYEVYLAIGDMEKSLYYINKSLELNPLWKGNDNWYYLVTGKTHEVQKSMEKTNKNYGIGFTYLRGMSDSAVFYLEQQEVAKKEDQGENYNAGAAPIRYGAALIDVGREEEGRVIMDYHLQFFENQISSGSANRGTLFKLATIYSFLGETDKAISNLKKLEEDYTWSSFIYLLQVDPLFDNLREDEEFQKIISKQLQKNKNIREKIAKLEAAGEL